MHILNLSEIKKIKNFARVRLIRGLSRKTIFRVKNNIEDSVKEDIDNNK